jgi:hypothetical protein
MPSQTQAGRANININQYCGMDELKIMITSSGTSTDEINTVDPY